MPEKGQSSYPDMPDIHIGEAGVLKLLNNINSHKAIGPDGIQLGIVSQLRLKMTLYTILY
jgi:hypothetical protein